MANAEHKRLVLIEHYGKAVRIEPRDCVVSLTAQANFALEKAGIPHHTPQDFGTEQEIQKHQQTYWEDQLLWLQEIDRALCGHISLLKERKIRPAILYGYFLKIWMDYRFIQTVEASTLLKQGFDDVVFWPETASDSAMENFFDSSLSVYGAAAQVWSHLCRNSGVTFHLQKTLRPPYRPIFGWKRGADRLKTWTQRYLPRTIPDPQKTAAGPSTFLFLDQGYDLAMLFSEAQAAGHRCLVCHRDQIPLLKRRTQNTLDEEFWKAAQEIFSSSSPIWQWPNRWVGVPMTPLLAGHLQEWVRTILPEMVWLSEDFRRLYQAEDIRLVLTTGRISNIHIASVAACEPEGNTQSALIAHGDGADVEPAWDLFDMFPYQHYFVPHEEFASYFRERRTLYSEPTAQVHVGSYRWNRYTCLANRQGRNCPQPEVLKTRKPVVVYACGQPEHDVRYLNTFRYPEVWYFHLQKKLIHTFASVLNYSFVIKLFPGDGKRKTALKHFVRDLRAPNLFVSEVPFRDWLPWASRLILDTPSTPMYEAALAGVPFHLIVPEGVRFRPEGIRPFSASVTTFRDAAEAAEQVKQRLRLPPPPIPVIQPEEAGILETLNRLREPAWETQTALSS